MNKREEAGEDGSLLRGTVFGFLLSIPIWAIIGLVVWGLVKWL